MASKSQDITFLIPGQMVASRSAAGASQAGGLQRGISKAKVQLGSQRAGGAAQRVSARPGEDVVLLTLANGPTLVLHPQAARDLMHAQSSGATRSALAAHDDDEVQVTANLAWPGLEDKATRGATRGWMGSAVLSAFEVVSGLLKDPAVSLATAAITRKVDGQVNAGVYALSPASLRSPLKHETPLQQVPAAADAGPLLILVHGTFVDTVSTFGKLFVQHPDKVRNLFAHYANRVYALDHPTMGFSPIANALTLVNALPAGARLHLLTHSRGGLVAEVLARACGGGALSEEELALFAGAEYEAHRRDLQALVKAAQAKGLKLERVVRVACPARGTTLASKRLDAYLSVLQWGLQLAGVPVAPELVDFVHEVARRRADPAELPGLEAMMPESPVVEWLNRSEAQLPGELRVVAGDLEGDSIGSWLKTLLSDAFYWTDNDLVVQTRSMYGGSPRSGAGAASFILDRGGKTNHFNYFSNERTVAAISSALTEAAPAEFSPIGPLSWQGKDASGTRAALAVARSRGWFSNDTAEPSPAEQAQRAEQAAKRPAVFVLPGILGSNIKRNGSRIWLGFRFVNGLMKLAWDEKTVNEFAPDGPIGSCYDALIERLADTHEVIPFAFDWRRPIEDEARRLGQAVDAAIAARRNSGQPVRIIAHSMGGLVARTMQLEAPATWRRMMAHPDARLLMLGTPNGGSWAPMQTLSGDDTFGNALVAFGALFDKGGARKMMAGMPGFMQLQDGLLDPQLGLDRAETWQKLADQDIAILRERSFWHQLESQISIYTWGAPPQKVLDQAVALRRRLDAQIGQLGLDKQKMLLVVGHASFTPAGIRLDPNDGLEYLDTPDDGDGRVTLASATQLGLRTWKLDAEHGKLPDVAEAFAAYVELLQTGDTRSLETLEARASRAAATTSTAGGAAAAAAASPQLQRSRPSRGLQASLPPSDAGDVMGLARHSAKRVAADQGSRALQMTVLNADLRFVQQPLLVGHYRSMTLTGAEEVIDALVNQGMSRALAAGLYPDAVGSHQIFGNQRPHPDNPFQMARPQAAIVVGLGEEGKLRTSELIFTVRQAVMAYAQRLSEQATGTAGSETPAPLEFELAATLIGSGGTGITTGAAAQAIAQGAWAAKQKLQGTGWPQLSRLTLTELYLDRAGDAWRALQQLEAASPGSYKLVGKVSSGPGAMRRMLDSNYRGSNYDFISALSVPGHKPDQPAIAYKLNTKRARSELREQHAQGALLREFVARASNDANTDTQIGRTLFNLLIPVEMEPFLGGSSELVIELEPATAGIPWELLNTNPLDSGEDKRPWAIRTKLIRKLQLDDYRAEPRDASADDHVLVIGEPLCDPTLYPRLEGARQEALAVAEQLSSGLGRETNRDGAELVNLLAEQNDAQTIINALFERNYRAIHIAGHGAPGPNGGVVLSGQNTYLSAAEVKSMRVVPELVFLNCCHLAGRDPNAVLQTETGAGRYDRASFAANTAEALIKVGVRCVVAAGWAVEDEAAKVFATTFYASLLTGARFIEAVGRAREAAWSANRQGNTWAAYQCYGDPEWTWRREGADAQRPSTPLADELAGVASPVSLTLTLENIAVRAQYGKSSPQKRQGALDKLRYLEAEFKPLWGSMGAVAEAFAVAYNSAGERKAALEWYRIAVEAEDGSASLKASEQYGNLLVREGEQQADLTQIRAGISLLERVLAVQPTVERENLMGSAWKHLAMVLELKQAQAAGKAVPPAVTEALSKAAQHYSQAAQRCLQAQSGELFYPRMNAMAIELRLAFQAGRPITGSEGAESTNELSAEAFKAARDSLTETNARKPDFWSVVGQTELDMLQALSQSSLAGAAGAVLQSLQALKVRVPAPAMWDTVYKQARFTLEPYQSVSHASAALRSAEQKAAKQLLEGIKALAAGSRS
ncbi:CHAT domain-containing protein [Paucibacter sp. KCTC 42545]|uniref:CHAT domain-containing protein n=1 Tax=Paucibacter sp. KCTC 42545 TaxID=1768242 RepID=UPI000733B330|nr:CHAT domain-containing protein [Paucibacter sp. KCTC 42545]ALT78011.1 hypothetical protein AT984_13310 [Paucibacter sp. KCTC 42545]